MKTDFKRFRIKNALSFEYADMPLDNQGLVFIQGSNLDEGDSNGSGKTTLFELLALSLFDKLTKTDRRVTKTSLMNMHRPKGFLTRLDLDIDSVPHVIENFRSHPKKGTGMTIYRDKVNVTPDDPREARKMISRLIGLSWNEYLGRVYLSQRYTHMMIDGTPAQKKEYLSMSFGLDTLDAMAKEVTKRLNAIPLPDETQLQSMLDSVNSDLDSLSSEEDLEAEYARLSLLHSDIQDQLVSLRVELEKHELARSFAEERSEWKKKLKPYGIKLESSTLKSKVDSVRSSLDSHRQDLQNLLKRNKLESALSSLTDDLSLSLEDMGDIESKLYSTESKLEARESILPEVERKHKLLEKLQSIPSDELSVAVLSARVEKWSGKLSELKGTASSLKSELSKLESLEDVCYACLRPIDAQSKSAMLKERQDALAELSSLRNNAVTALSHYEDRLAAANKRAEVLLELDDLLSSADLVTLQKEIADLRKLRSTLRTSLSSLSKYRSVLDQLSEIPPVSGSVSHYEARIEELSSSLLLLEKAYAWSLKHGDTFFDPHALQRSMSSVADMTERLSDTNAELIRVKEMSVRVSSLKKQKSEITRSLNSSSAEKNRSRVLRYLNITLDDLRKAALRDSTQLLSTVLPVYLNQLFPGGSIQLEVTDDADGFDLMFRKGDRSIPLTLISGGQAKRVGLAIIFAFAKMGRNTTNLLICDEPFRDLDKKGREACFEVLRDFNMGTVLVTSHDHDMSSLRRYDQVWTVKMENHVSRLLTE